MNKKNIDDLEKKIEENVNKDSVQDSQIENKNLENYDISLNTTKEKMSKIPFLIGFFLIVTISISTCFIFLKNNPQTNFVVAVDDFFSSINQKIDDNAYKISKSNIKINFDIDSKEEIYKELSKNNFDINIITDSSNNRSFYKVKTNYEGQDSFNLNIYNSKNSTYILYKNVYDKYIKYDNKKSYTNLKNKDIKNILNGINQAIDKVATSEKIVGSKSNFDYDIKTIRASISKLTIDKTNYKRVSNTFINSLKSNEEFISSISKIYNLSSSETKKKLDKLEKHIINYLKESEKTEVVITADRRNHNFIKGSVSSKLGTYEIIKKPDYYTININDNKKGLKIDSKIEIKDKNKTKVNANFELISKNIKGKLDISYTNKKAESFPIVKIEDAINEKEMTDTDKIGIYSKLLENESIYNIVKLIK